MDIFERRKDGYLISTDHSRIDLELVHRELANSYWARDIPRDLVEKSIAHSLNFGLYQNDNQIAFARVVTDRATFAYLGDVFVVEACKGRGLSKWLMETILAHPDLQGLRRFCLGTRDAHGLYARYGFQVIKEPENWMEIKARNLYSIEQKSK